MARLPEPRNAAGSAPRTTGTPLPSNSIQQPIPPGVGYFNPIIQTAGNTAGDTVYFLLTNIFDPRVVQTTSRTNTYSAFNAGQSYADIWNDLLYQVIFSAFRMRQEPSASTIIEMLEVIIDTTRMLGIYLTALTMSASRDPDMFLRSRVLGLYDAKVEMQTMLASHCLPRYLVEASIKYVRLMDVAGSYNFQNVGFLMAGDFDAFLTLNASVSSKYLARNFLRTIYPEIGLIGDPNGMMIPDVLEAFVNANYKSGTNGFAPYVLVDGSSGEAQRLASGGMLHSVYSAAGNGLHTVSGFAVPGSGIGNVGAVRTYAPALCAWKSATGKDAAIHRSGTAQVYGSAGGVITYETLIDSALAANIVHEYNMNNSDTTPMRSPLTINANSGILSDELLATDDARYRVTAGFGLANVTFNLQANVVSLFRDILLP